MSLSAGISRQGQRAAVSAGFLVLFVCTGANYVFGVLFRPILDEFGWTRATLSTTASVAIIVYAFGQFFAGRLIDRFGCRRVILPSMLVMALGIGLTATARAPSQLTLWLGVIASIGYSGTGILPISILIGRWFPDRSSMVLAVAACGFSLGQLVFSQFALWAAATAGWRGAYLWIASC